MKEFVLIFRMDIISPEARPTPEQAQVYMQQWMDWTDSIDDEGKLVGGNHLSTQGRVLKTGNEQSETPYIADSMSVAGYIIIEADDLDDATKIARRCPILTGQNTSVEVRETARPGQ